MSEWMTIAYFRCREQFISGTHILHGLLHTARTGSVYVTIAVTIERYFAVVHPTKEFKMKVLLLPFAIIFAVLYNIPKEFLANWRSFILIICVFQHTYTPYHAVSPLYSNTLLLYKWEGMVQYIDWHRILLGNIITIRKWIICKIINFQFITVFWIRVKTLFWWIPWH